MNDIQSNNKTMTSLHCLVSSVYLEIWLKMKMAKRTYRKNLNDRNFDVLSLTKSPSYDRPGINSDVCQNFVNI